MEQFVYLQSLDLSNNLLGSLSGVSQMMALRELKVSHNQISSLDGMQTLVNLTVFEVSHNRIGDLREIVRLKQNSQLREVWFEGNPIAANKT
jgi:Leucine-rich repeat (LRR) protein